MPGSSRWWWRLDRLLGAVTLLVSLAALLYVGLERVSAVSAVGVIFAVPILAVAGQRIARGIAAAVSGSEVHRGRFGEPDATPPERLGRPTWERRPNVRCS